MHLAVSTLNESYLKHRRLLSTTTDDQHAGSLLFASKSEGQCQNIAFLMKWLPFKRGSPKRHTYNLADRIYIALWFGSNICFASLHGKARDDKVCPPFAPSPIVNMLFWIGNML